MILLFIQLYFWMNGFFLNKCAVLAIGIPSYYLFTCNSSLLLNAECFVLATRVCCHSFFFGFASKSVHQFCEYRIRRNLLRSTCRASMGDTCVIDYCAKTKETRGHICSNYLNRHIYSLTSRYFYTRTRTYYITMQLFFFFPNFFCFTGRNALFQINFILLINTHF